MSVCSDDSTTGQKETDMTSKLKTEAKPLSTPAKRRVRTRRGKPAVPQVKAPVKVEVPTTLYKALVTPRGKALFTYWLAVMDTLGGFTSGRKTMSKKKVVSFFKGPSVINNHTKNGNLEVTGDNVRLTVTGWNYFSGRLTGSTVGQDVDKPEMEAVSKALRTGKLDKATERFAVNTVFVEIKE